MRTPVWALFYVKRVAFSDDTPSLLNLFWSRAAAARGMTTRAAEFADEGQVRNDEGDGLAIGNHEFWIEERYVQGSALEALAAQADDDDDEQKDT